MTNEQKLKRLVDIASENGWNCAGFRSSDCIEHWINNPNNQSSYFIEGLTLVCYPANSSWPTEFVSINDIVVNFDRCSTSFIGALCKYSNEHFKNVMEYKEIYDIGSNLEESIIINWTLYRNYIHGGGVENTVRVSDDRLDWLFGIFSHLLNQ